MGTSAPIPARPSARQELLDRTMVYVAHHGMSSVSLRELATAVGTSHRMLIYHFGNREGLVAAIVAAMEAQQRVVLEQLADAATNPRDVITAQWRRLADPALRPFVVLFFEVLALALQRRPGADGFLEQLTAPWLDLASELARRWELPTTREEMLLGIAVVRGLILEAVASGDYEASAAALHRFLEMWDGDRSRRG